MNAFVSLVRSLPLVVFLGVLAVVVFAAASSRRDADRAKAVLLRIFGALTSFLTVLFSAGIAYALLENNKFAAEVLAGFAAVSAIALVITLVCRWRFLVHRPTWRKEHTRRWERFV